jgi:WD40 repeat protein
MRRFPCWLVVLVCPALAWGQDRQDRDGPFLAFNSDAHTAPIRKVLFRPPDGKELITVSEDKTAIVWDAAHGVPLRVLRPPVGTGELGKLLAGAVSPDGDLLAVAGFHHAQGNNPIYVISLKDGAIEQTLPGQPGEVHALAFAPDGKRLASGGDDVKDHRVRVWDLKTGRVERELEGHTAGINGLVFDPKNGRRLVSVSADHTGRIWDVVAGKPQAILPHHGREVLAVAWSPDGKTIATGAADDRRIVLWDTRPSGGKEIKPRQEDLAPVDLGGRTDVFALDFAPDSKKLLVTWNVVAPDDTLSCTWGGTLVDLDTGKRQVGFHKGGARWNGPCGALAPDGTRAVTAGGYDHEAFVWKTEDAPSLTPQLPPVKWVKHLGGRVHTPVRLGWSPAGLELAWGTTDPQTGAVPREDRALQQVFLLAGQDFGPAYPYFDDRGHVLLLGKPFSFAGFAQGRIDKGVLHVERGGFAMENPLGAPAITVKHGDRPLLSLFVAGSDWIAWTPEGYYDATPGGEWLMGWHVNNGPDAMGTFHPAQDFRKELYRPGVIRRLLAEGSVAKALAAADRAAGRRPGSKPVTVAEVLPPKIRSVTARQEGKVIVVKATAEGVRGHVVESLQLRLDGRPWTGKDAVVTFRLDQRGPVEAKWEVPDVELPAGAHQCDVLAQSDVSQVRSDPVSFTCTRPGVRDVVRPRMYVVAIGIDKYKLRDLELASAVQDAKEIANLFNDKDRQLPDLPLADRPRVVTNEQATRAGILKTLLWLRTQMGPKDVAVISYSGHGERDDKGHFAMLPVDFDADKFAETTVSGQELKKELAQTHGKVLVLLDACHSGAIGSFADDLTRILTDDDCGVAVMCAAMSRQTAGESAKIGHGFFTKAVLEGLQGAADYDKDGKVDLTELDLYVSRRVRQLSRDQQRAGCTKPATLSFFELVVVPPKK